MISCRSFGNCWLRVNDCASKSPCLGHHDNVRRFARQTVCWPKCHYCQRHNRQQLRPYPWIFPIFVISWSTKWSRWTTNTASFNQEQAQPTWPPTRSTTTQHQPQAPRRAPTATMMCGNPLCCDGHMALCCEWLAHTWCTFDGKQMKALTLTNLSRNQPANLP